MQPILTKIKKEKLIFFISIIKNIYYLNYIPIYKTIYLMERKIL